MKPLMMNKESIARRLSLFGALFAFSSSALAQSAVQDEARAQKIVEAFNSRPADITAPLTRPQVMIYNGQGRVDVNPKVKFSYFIQTPLADDPANKTLLIPMATSRYTPTYYQTDEWWDAHKEEIEKARREGLPMPRQDMDEVATWLKEGKLSTNPNVIEVSLNGEPARFIPLQEFLKNHIIENYASDGYVTLYRGGEKPGEVDFWLRGEKPKGARYWTPTANYAWRYARKNKAFLDELLQGRAPLFVFRIPVKDFVAMVDRRWPRLTLGTELTKNAHNAFDSGRVFKDHLYQTEYPGEGRLGVEIEVRSNRAGAEDMVRYFNGPISIEELANDRVRVLKRAAERLKQTYPSRAREFEDGTARRVARTLAEARVLIALREKMPIEAVSELSRQLNSSTAEIANIDSVYFDSYVRGAMAGLPSDPSVRVELARFDAQYGLGDAARVSRGSVESGRVRSCEGVF
jgi:hypothetical protein